MNIEADLKTYKNCWLYHKKTDETIFIRHLVYYEGTNEVKISLFKSANKDDEKIFKYQEFLNFISNYSKTKKRISKKIIINP
jgi:hypothetical protein